MVTVKDDIAMFRFFRPDARQVFLVGEFDHWSHGTHPMVRTPEGYWIAALRLPPGNHRFRYRADNQWFADYAAFGIEYGPFGPDSVVRVESPRRAATNLPADEGEAASPSANAMAVALATIQEREHK